MVESMPLMTIGKLKQLAKFAQSLPDQFETIISFNETKMTPDEEHQSVLKLIKCLIGFISKGIGAVELQKMVGSLSTEDVSSDFQVNFISSLNNNIQETKSAMISALDQVKNQVTSLIQNGNADVTTQIQETIGSLEKNLAMQNIKQFEIVSNLSDGGKGLEIENLKKQIVELQNENEVLKLKIQEAIEEKKEKPIVNEAKTEKQEDNNQYWRLTLQQGFELWTYKYEKTTTQINYPKLYTRDKEISIEVSYEGMTTNGIPNGFGFIQYHKKDNDQEWWVQDFYGAGFFVNGILDGGPAIFVKENGEVIYISKMNQGKISSCQFLNYFKFSEETLYGWHSLNSSGWLDQNLMLDQYGERIDYCLKKFAFSHIQLQQVIFNKDLSDAHNAQKKINKGFLKRLYKKHINDVFPDFRYEYSAQQILDSGRQMIYNLPQQATVNTWNKEGLNFKRFPID